MLAIEFALDVCHFLHTLIPESGLTYAKGTHTFVQHSTARIENKLGGIHRDIQVCGLAICFVDLHADELLAAGNQDEARCSWYVSTSALCAS